MSRGHGGGRAGSTARRHKKHPPHEEHENHERWLISYADMMTLLMVLFIVLFAISQVDATKFVRLKAGLAAGFGAESVAMEGSGNKLHEGADDPEPFDPGSKVGVPVDAEAAAAQDKELQAAVAKADRVRQSQMTQHAEAEVEKLKQIQAQITAELAAKGMADKVRFAIDERGLVVTIVTSAVIFPGDSAELLHAGREVLESIGPSVAALPNKIQVDGHTNQLPVQTQNYPSGWELSSARASSVVRYLIEHHHLPEARMSAAGYADTRPLNPATDPQSVTVNRRVEVVVLSSLPADERALLPAAAGNHD
jgi:chemotaxis protein MotB